MFIAVTPTSIEPLSIVNSLNKKPLKSYFGVTFELLSKIIKNYQKLSKIIKNYQKLSKIIKKLHQKLSLSIKNSVFELSTLIILPKFFEILILTKLHQIFKLQIPFYQD
jgi:hypothetical protein